MLYGAEVWADSMRYEKYRKRLATVQRMGALPVACSYRTVSEAAVLVIAGVIPVDLLAQGLRTRARGGRRPAYWWTNEIAELGKKCLKLKRAAQCGRKCECDFALRNAEYLVAKRALGRAIEASKHRCWNRLRDDLNNDPWGLGYKIVMRKHGAFTYSAPMEAETMDRIVDAIFHAHPKRSVDPKMPEDLEVPPFTEAELRRAAGPLKNKKAPGPEGLPAKVLKAVARSHPDLLLNMYNSCLRAGVFYSRWKEARLVLKGKGKGPADAPSSYRPLCMLDTAEKILASSAWRCLRAVS